MPVPQFRAGFDPQRRVLRFAARRHCRPPGRAGLAVSARRRARGAVGSGPATAGRERPSAWRWPLAPPHAGYGRNAAPPSSRRGMRQRRVHRALPELARPEKEFTKAWATHSPIQSRPAVRSPAEAARHESGCGPDPVRRPGTQRRWIQHSRLSRRASELPTQDPKDRAAPRRPSRRSQPRGAGEQPRRGLASTAAQPAGQSRNRWWPRRRLEKSSRRGSLALLT